MLKLHFKDGRQAPVWLVEERFTIGQDRRSQLVLADPGISDCHAEIQQRDGHYYLSDCGSATGTFVNDQRIGTDYQLRAGDRLRLGGVELQLHEPNQAPVRPDATVRWFLQVASGEQIGKKFQIQPGSMGFGRSPKSELCFSDPELSRRHCEFFLKDDVLEVKDMASANGVYVNQRKVGTATLKPGDEVRMGSVSLLVIGPRVDTPVEAEVDDDADATQFVRALDLPKLDKPKASSSRATVNPLRAAAQPSETPAAAALAGGQSPLVIGLIAGGGLLLVVSVAAALLL